MFNYKQHSHPHLAYQGQVCRMQTGDQHWSGSNVFSHMWRNQLCCWSGLRSFSILIPFFTVGTWNHLDSNVTDRTRVFSRARLNRTNLYTEFKFSHSFLFFVSAGGCQVESSGIHVSSKLSLTVDETRSSRKSAFSQVQVSNLQLW